MLCRTLSLKATARTNSSISGIPSRVSDDTVNWASVWVGRLPLRDARELERATNRPQVCQEKDYQQLTRLDSMRC
jgi:hypothetical protein